MSLSQLEQILDAVVADHNTVAYQIGGVGVPAVKRKLPKREETVDPANQITVNGSVLADKVRRISRESYQVLYRVEMTLITPNDHDAIQGLSDHLSWREQTRQRYQGIQPLAPLALVKKVEIQQAPLLDRTKLAQGYDYDQVVILVWAYETVG